MRTQIRVEYTYDPEVDNWTWNVPAIRASGDGMDRRDAENQAVGAIVYALEGVAKEFDDVVSQVDYIEVDVKPGWPPRVGKPEVQQPAR